MAWNKTHGRTASAHVAAREREKRVLEMRIASIPFRVIAEELGISVAAAHKIANRAMDRLTTEVGEKVDEYKRMQLAQLDELQMALWPQAIGYTLRGPDGRPELDKYGRPIRVAPDVKAAREVRGILERKAELLGLDAPRRQEIKGSMGTVGFSLDDLLSKSEDELREILNVLTGTQAPEK